MKGETIFPKKIPNLNQILFNGVKIFEFKIPKIRKNNEIKSGHTLILPWSNKGYAATNKKTIKKTIPKLLLELILIVFLFNTKSTKVVSSYPLY